MLASQTHRLPLHFPVRGAFAALPSRLGALVNVATTHVYQLWCGLLGHTHAYHFEPNRVSLHCLNCGHNTPGWTITRARR